MKRLLDEGEISELASDSGEFGWSGEVHLLKHKGKKYVLRICRDLDRAERYEKISHIFKRHRFLPKFLGRVDNKILYEYIEGRDLRKHESGNVIEQVGKICASINKIRARGDVRGRFEKYLRRVSSDSNALISKKEVAKARRAYNLLYKKVNPTITLDASDVNHSNFRLRKGRVYMVDIEAIGPRIKLFGVGKAFLRWFKSPREQEFFKKGYRSVSSLKFLTKEYEDFIYLNFLVQEIHLATVKGKEYKPRYPLVISQLRDLLSTYATRNES